MPENKERIIWLDWARVIAIFLVIFTHSHEQASINNVLLNSLFYSVDRMAVPIFFMLSGGLILDKAHKYDIVSFYKRKLPKFIIVIPLIAILTNISSMYFVKDYSISDSLLTSIVNHNGLTNGNYGSAIQLWYMYSIILLYIISPFLSKMLNALSNKEVVFFILICFVFNQVKNTLVYFFPEFKTLNRFGVDYIGPYVSYFVIGYFILHRLSFNAKLNYFNLKASLWFFMISCFLVLLFLDFNNGTIIKRLHWYSNSIFIFISSVSFFILLRFFFIDKRCPNIVRSISYCSFGMYLYHYAFLWCVVGVLSIYPIPNVIKLISYFLLTSILSFLFTYYFRKFEFFKKWLS